MKKHWPKVFLLLSVVMFARMIEELILHIDLVNNGVMGTAVVTYYDPAEYTAGRNIFNKETAHNHVVRIDGERYEVRLDKEHKLKETIDIIYVPRGQSYRLPGQDSIYLNNVLYSIIIIILMLFMYRKFTPN